MDGGLVLVLVGGRFGGFVFVRVDEKNKCYMNLQLLEC